MKLNNYLIGILLVLLSTTSLKNYFTYNGKKLGGIADKQFGQSFLAIWLSPKTSRPAIRKRLIS